MKQRISQKAFDLIVDYESGGREYYEKVYKKRPIWPEGSSGVTIGFGYDVGYEKNLDRDWGKFLNDDQLQRLSRCLGKTGSKAQQALSGVRDIVIEWEWAAEVFNECTLPQEIRGTLKLYPGSADKLPADAFGVLVSLRFNRGDDLDGPRRIEMRRIGEIIARMPVLQVGLPLSPGQRAALKDIASQFRSMKRLWRDDPNSDGDLVDRREDEAKLIEQSALV